MTATDTGSVRLSFAQESSFGVAPTGTYDPLRITGEELKANIQHVESEVLRADSQIDNVIRSQASGGGVVRGELQYGEHDAFIQASIMSATWAASASQHSSSTVDAVAAAGGVPGYINDTGAGNFVVTGWKAGMWAEMSGWTTTGLANNGIWKVVHVTAERLYLQGGTIATKAVGDNIVIKQVAVAVNGVTVPWYTAQREHTQASPLEVHRFTGLAVNRFGLSIPQEGRITTEMELIGKIPSSETALLGSLGAVKTSRTMTSGGEVVAVYLGDPELDNITTSNLRYDVNFITAIEASMQFTPNIRPRTAVGTVGPVIAPGKGTINATGSIRLYYNSGVAAQAGRDDKALLDEFIAGTDSSLAIITKDVNNQFYVFELPKIRWTDGGRTTPRINEDVIAAMDFQAFVNPAEDNPNPNVDGVTVMVGRGVIT